MHVIVVCEVVHAGGDGCADVQFLGGAEWCGRIAHDRLQVALQDK